MYFNVDKLEPLLLEYAEEEQEKIHYVETQTTSDEGMSSNTKNNKNYSSEYEEGWKERELDLDMDTMDELVKFASLILDYGVKESSDVAMGMWEQLESLFLMADTNLGILDYFDGLEHGQGVNDNDSDDDERGSVGVNLNTDIARYLLREGDNLLARAHFEEDRIHKNKNNSDFHTNDEDEEHIRVQGKRNDKDLIGVCSPIP